MLLPSPNLLTEPLVLQARGTHTHTHTHVQTHKGRLRLAQCPPRLVGWARSRRACHRPKGRRSRASRHFGLSFVLGGRMDWFDLTAEGLDRCSRLYRRHYRFFTWYVACP